MPLLFSPPAIVLLCLLQAAFGQGDYSWNGPGFKDMGNDPNAGNGEELWVHNRCVCIYSCLQVHLCVFVFSVSNGPGLLWMLSDDARDEQAEHVLHHDPE